MLEGCRWGKKEKGVATPFAEMLGQSCFNESLVYKGGLTLFLK